jgi:hypothetical protein
VRSNRTGLLSFDVKDMKGTQWVGSGCEGDGREDVKDIQGSARQVVSRLADSFGERKLLPAIRFEFSRQFLWLGDSSPQAVANVPVPNVRPPWGWTRLECMSLPPYATKGDFTHPEAALTAIEIKVSPPPAAKP